MIHHEARTRTIRECTGLSDDRIRKLFGTYFQDAATRHIKRRRGKSPRQVGRFVKSPLNPCWPRPDVDYGHRVCRAFETYLLLHPGAKLSFEWAWNLLQTISHNDELYLAACDNCNTAYVQDSYALDHRVCPSCEISRQSGRRTGR
jgi:hypothetical protein